MARLNTRPSNAPSSRYVSRTPAPRGDIDQENQDPALEKQPQGKERVMPPPPSRSSLPTPTSGGSSDQRGQKRKRRLEDDADATQATQITQADEDSEGDARATKYFDPNQDPDVRRQLKRKTRALEREFNETRDEILRGSAEGLSRTINRANRIFEKVKQTSDATVDSRLFVGVSDLAHKKVAQLVFSDNSAGVDVDEFLSKCLTFMRNGSPGNTQDQAGSSTRQRGHARDRRDSDDEDDGGGGVLDWEFLGRHACFPYNSRPPVPTFLLGPLSVEKKQRTQTQRRARQQQDTQDGREARPEALTKDDLQQSDQNGLMATCARIHKQLARHISQAEASLQRAGFTAADMDTERAQAMLRKHRLAKDGNVPLFDFVLNPRSFGQSVENLFYISFLIKEGSISIEHDPDGLPTLLTAEPSNIDQQRENRTSKHQAVFALDHDTWRDLIKAFDIRESMIPHREESQPTQMGGRGWYT